MEKINITSPFTRAKVWWGHRIPKWILGIFLIIILVGAVTAHTEYRFRKISRLQNENESNLSTLTQSIGSLTDSVKVLEEQNQDLMLILENERAKSGTLLDQFSTIKSSVGDLEKLAKTDPQLLQKYSKVYFLNENYIPIKLTNIIEDYLFNKNTPLQIHGSVAPYLKKLLEASRDDDLDLKIISAYRSFGTQATLKSSYKTTYGTTKANQFSADQGYSEHQLGTTLDFTTASVGSTFAGFDKTPEYAWLLQNAYRYGFVLSYPSNNKYYQFEPWHWRFVGIELAERLHDEEKYFYDLDQRQINEYLGSIFD